ncbi:MAG: hypothetical protein Q9174_007201 [Haloplaca sp. 1 TL-2023]
MSALDEHLSSSAPLYDTLFDFSRQILRDIPGADYAEMNVRVAREKFITENWTNLTLGMTCSKPTNTSNSKYINQTMFSGSDWEIPIRFKDTESVETLGVRLHIRWQDKVRDQDPDLRVPQSKDDYAWSSPLLYGSKRGKNGLRPLLDLHLRLAEWIQGEIHVSHESLGLGYALCASDLSERIFGPGRATIFEIRIGVLSEVPTTEVDLVPRPRVTYRYNASHIRQIRSAIHKGDQASTRRAYIALGSNVGDRMSMVEQACRAMNRRGIKLLRTSSIYETVPMYKIDQASFLNGVCEVETTLSPHQLLAQLKAIEDLLGRVKTVVNGPRSIDLDILLYGKEIVQDSHLQIPHPRISEREFVLRPLSE